MGSYGIGLGRCMAAIVEQNHDDKGIIWPMMVAPYQVAIVVVDTNDELQMKVANDLYTQLTDLKIDTILDDRDERIGVKFNDMDLIGIPIRITIGKIVKEEKIEFKLRTGQTEEIKLVDVINRIDEQIKKTIK
jgi:prolyl-tRNA synthetase